MLGDQNTHFCHKLLYFLYCSYFFFHPLQTRSKMGMPNPIYESLIYIFFSDDIEPTWYTSASKDPPWRFTMAKDYKALLHKNTWNLVPPHDGKNIVGHKWVFCIRWNSGGSVSCFKACLFAMGYNEHYAIDFEETISPVMMPLKVRLVLSIMVIHSWSIKQFDVSNAFLQAYKNKCTWSNQLG